MTINKGNTDDYTTRRLLFGFCIINDHAKDGGRGEVRLLCSFYQDPLMP